MGLRHSDVLVVGGELAGAVTAAVCARAGKRVVVLEEGEAETALELHGLQVSPPDDLWPAMDHLPRGMAPLDALGLRADLRRVLVPARCGLQVIHPQHRLELAAEPGRLTQELRREWGGNDNAAAVAALTGADPAATAAWTHLEGLDPLEAEGFFAERRARSASREALAMVSEVGSLKLPQQMEPLAAALTGVLPFVTHAAAPPPLGAQRLLHALVASIWVAPAGGRHALRGLLLDAARNRGAEVIADERAAAVVVEGGRVAEVRLTGRTDALAGRAIVDATRSRDLAERISPEKYARKVEAMQAQAVASHVRVAVVWVIRSAGVPPGLGERALLCGENEDPGQGPALLACQRQPLAADGKKTVSGLATLSLCTVATTPTAGAAALALTARMDALLPFARTHMVDHKVLADPPYLNRHAVYSSVGDAVLMAGRGVDGGLKGLLRAGRDVAPMLGVEGELWAGAAAGHRAQKLSGGRGGVGAAEEKAS